MLLHSGLSSDMPWRLLVGEPIGGYMCVLSDKSRRSSCWEDPVDITEILLSR